MLEATNCQNLYTVLYLNYRDLFSWEDFVGGIGQGFFVLQTLFWNHASWSQKRKYRGLHRLHPHPRLTLSIWKFRNRVPAFSSNFVRIALVAVCPSASLAGLMSSSWLRLLRRLKWANKCFCFRPDIKKIWKERKLKCLTKMPYQNAEMPY